MFEDKVIACAVNGVMLDVGKMLDASLAQVQENCSAVEFEQYRDIVGRIMGEMLIEVMNPIYSRYPELEPPGLE